MNSELIAICSHLQEKVRQVPQLNLRSIDDDQGHGGREHIQSLIAEHSQHLAPKQQLRLLDEFCSTGPLTPLLDLSNVTEIIINGPNDIWYEKEGKILLWEDHFLSLSTYRGFIQRLFQETGTHIDFAQPTTDGQWRGFRFHAIGEPLTSGETKVTLRKHPENPWTLSQLNEHGWCLPSEAKALRKLIEEKSSMLIIGPTGSGKTSILSACLQNLPSNERVLILEDTPEISVPNSLSLRLLTREDERSALPSFKLSDLIRNALRMRPDRLVMGEIRGPEAKDLLLTLSTGHQGGLATLHAQSPQEALMRLEVLIQLGAPQWSLETVRRLIFHGLQYVIVTTKNEERRQFAGAFRLVSLESCGFLLEREF